MLAPPDTATQTEGRWFEMSDWSMRTLVQTRWLIAPAVGLFLAGSASALSMNVVASEVFVDTFASAETDVEDPPLETSPSIALQISEEVFLFSLNEAVAVAVARASRLPTLQMPTTLRTRASLDLRTRTDGSVTAQASGFSGGSLQLDMIGSPASDPGPGLRFDFDFELLEDAPTSLWSLSYRVVNQTLGAILFDLVTSNPAALPMDPFFLPAGIGDRILVEWSVAMGIAAANGSRTSAELDLDVLITPQADIGPIITSAAPSSALLLSALLPLLWGVRARLGR